MKLAYHISGTNGHFTCYMFLLSKITSENLSCVTPGVHIDTWKLDFALLLALLVQSVNNIDIAPTQTFPYLQTDTHIYFAMRPRNMLYLHWWAWSLLVLTGSLNQPQWPVSSCHVPVKLVHHLSATASELREWCCSDPPTTTTNKHTHTPIHIAWLHTLEELSAWAMLPGWVPWRTRAAVWGSATALPFFVSP